MQTETKRIKRKINVANPTDKSWQKSSFLFWFGACAPTFVLAYGRGIEDALEEAADCLEEIAPGHFCQNQVGEDYEVAISEGKTHEEAVEEAESDTTCLDGGRYLMSYEWGIVFENPSPKELVSFYKDSSW